MRDDRKVARSATLATNVNASQKQKYRMLSQGKPAKSTDVGGAAANRRTAEVQNAG
jgi:hypothetical protein